MEYTHIIPEEDYLEHHGIKGMRWGVRRYQNPDGSLTEAGRRHYDIKEAKIKARGEAKVAKLNAKAAKAAIKASKAELKREANLAKVEKEKLKIDLKRMKKESAYERGKQFGDAFVPKFGEKFGETFGSGMGNTLGNWQKWKELRNTKYANKTARMEKVLEKAKFGLKRGKIADDSYAMRKLDNEAGKNAADLMKQKAEWRKAYSTYVKNVKDLEKTRIDYQKYLNHLREEQGGTT